MRSKVIAKRTTPLFLSPSGRGRPAGPGEGESIHGPGVMGYPQHPLTRTKTADLSPEGEVKEGAHVL